MKVVFILAVLVLMCLHGSAGIVHITQLVNQPLQPVCWSVLVKGEDGARERCPTAWVLGWVVLWGITSDGDVAKPAVYCRAGSGLQRPGEEEVAAGSPGLGA